MLIYCIKNTINNKEYVGLTTRSLNDRWKQHLYESNKQDSWEWNTPLGNAIKKYGEDAFELSVLANCGSVEELKQKEIELIEQRKSLVEHGGYNVTKGGDGRLGAKHTEETKIKIGLGNLGKIMSDVAKEKMSIAAQKRCVGKPSPMEGKKHSIESKQKIISHLTGRKHSEESKRKCSDSQKGIKKSPEAIEKMRNSLKAYHQNKKQLELGILNG